ncbi:hypothetical protein Vadar_030001 [Vaccinium darrowii]|uniref:Uncharacterized protein n=1 Tax=Vaccinium darrowii TaxID=229202 RepID=A0ACB7Y2Q3_9ERIC|nr:hypothetical protein Vadar_030001 [Vaccinium darrowii]
MVRTATIKRVTPSSTAKTTCYQKVETMNICIFNRLHVSSWSICITLLTLCWYPLGAQRYECGCSVAQRVRRAERAGFKAIAITVDTLRLGRRDADLKTREKAMVVNLEFIKAIVIAEEVLLLDPLRHEVLPFVDQLRQQLPDRSRVKRWPPYDHVVQDGAHPGVNSNQ